jgi:hypothetical protein
MMELGGSSHPLAIKRVLPRHIEIMERLMAGQKQSEIARDMGMSSSRISIIINSPLFQLEFRKKLMKRETKVIEIQTNILEAAVLGSKLEKEVIEDPNSAYPIILKLQTADRVSNRAMRVMDILKQATTVSERDFSGEEGGGGSYEERLRKVTFEEKVTTVSPKSESDKVKEAETGSVIDPDEIEYLLADGRPSEELMRQGNDTTD